MLLICEVLFFLAEFTFTHIAFDVRSPFLRAEFTALFQQNGAHTLITALSHIRRSLSRHVVDVWPGVRLGQRYHESEKSVPLCGLVHKHVLVQVVLRDAQNSNIIPSPGTCYCVSDLVY